MPDNPTTENVIVDAAGVPLEGMVTVPDGARGLVIFVHGSGSSRHSSRNQFVARRMNEAGLATLLFDLLTPDEDRIDQRAGELRFDIPMLGERTVGAVDWCRKGGQVHLRMDLSPFSVGLFGASTGAAAALIAAAERPDAVSAVVSRGGRPDLAHDHLPRVKVPVLLLVGSLDTPVIAMNRAAAAQLTCEHRLEIIPGATHLFEEPGKLENVAELAAAWLVQHLHGNENSSSASGRI